MQKNKLLIGILIISLTGGILVVLGVFFPKNENQQTEMIQGKPTETKKEITQKESKAVSDTSMKKEDDGVSKLSGMIVELSQFPETQDVQIVLSVLSDSGTQEEYKFFLSKGKTLGIENAKIENKVTLSFQGDPSSTSYVVADAITLMEK
ncbi:MAG: hypothetical protein IPN70_04450 [Candidatus Moraniibacteriota bacterium]|nr:MAG: hypothetical protein IPN70_04450 [Candidatus Moranbacteria bacterium]